MAQMTPLTGQAERRRRRTDDKSVLQGVGPPIAVAMYAEQDKSVLQGADV